MTRIDIEHITVAPNPVNARGGAYRITVDVTDTEVAYKNDTDYAGEIYAGQQTGGI